MSVGGAKGETRVEEPTAAERAIARRAAEARATVPDLELRADVDMAGALDVTESQGCSTTAIVARATALALRAVPRANGAYRDGRFELYSRVNIGIVVADEHSYLIPTVFDADRKALDELRGEVAELERDAIEGRLSASAFSGATFTVWNAGALEIGQASLPVVPGQAAILAAGTVSLTLTCDHRILYGAAAAGLLADVSRRLAGGSV